MNGDRPDAGRGIGQEARTPAGREDKTTTWGTPEGPGALPAPVQALLERVTRPETERTVTRATIALGGMGRIDEVLDRGLRRRAARKILPQTRRDDPRSIAQFVREAQITSYLDHPSIVPVHSLGLDRGQLYFTMKLVEGRTLASLIESAPAGPPSPRRLIAMLDVLLKVCDALALAHSRGVIHCDVKPENIMVGHFGEVYLMDWGIARFLRPPPEDIAPDTGPAEAQWGFASVEESAGVVGTIAYMAPEQALGDRRALGPATDVFGLGATLYEVLTGKPPYHDLSYPEGLVRMQEGRFPEARAAAPEREIPSVLAGIAGKALAREPEARYRSASDLKRALLDFMHGGTPFETVRFAPGEVITREGEPGDTAYMIVSGQCDVTRRIGGRTRQVRTMSAGDVFGETAILSPGPRTATVTARGAVVAEVVSAAALLDEVDAMRPWMSRFIRTLASRFRETEERRQAAAGGSADGAESPEALARLALMQARTFGDACGPDLRVSLGDLDPALRARLGADPQQPLAALAHPDRFEVDAQSGTLTVRGWAELARRLRYRDPAGG